jgi:hypothetical protein
MQEHLAEAREILKDAIVIDTLGGAVVHPTPSVTEGTYEEAMVGDGWTALHTTLVSEPSYTPTWEQVQRAIYENLLNFEMSPKVRHVEQLQDFYEAKKNGQLGVIFGIQSPSCFGQERERIRIL